MDLPFAWIELGIAILSQIFIIYQCYTLMDNMYKKSKNVFIRAPMLMAYCAILMTIFHPGDKGDWFVTQQMFVSFTIFLEACALIPQLEHLRTTKAPEGLATAYILCISGARFMRFFFWIAMMNGGDSFWYL